MSAADRSITSLDTPALLLDRPRMQANVRRLAEHLRTLGVPLRPHIKTAKSIPAIRELLEGQPGGVTVSTLAEAEACAAAGITDILYAVGIAPRKLERVQRLRERGADVTVILDAVETAQALVAFNARSGARIPALIEVDTDGHRAGVGPESAELLAVGAALGGALRGVMTHAGESYHCAGQAALQAMAEQERRGVVRAAERLRGAGLACAVVSAGSTPTATFAVSGEGLTEMRAGVHVFQDLVMAGLGVCRVEDIALSVLVTVIGHQASKGWLITDGGWMALSRDRGTAAQAVDQGYGLVCDVAGRLIPGLVMSGANQEHGIISVQADPAGHQGSGTVGDVAVRSGGAGAAPDLRRFPVGTLLRIVPNHACATAAQYPGYQVLEGAERVTAYWERFNGW